MVAAALAGLVAANVIWFVDIPGVWNATITITAAGRAVDVSVATLVVDGLMALFFLSVGIEIRKEVAFGSLRSPRAALTPILCAAGGMVVPMAIYRLIVGGGEAATGWAVPSATDVALAVGLLALLAPGLSPGARAFLLTLAVADDLGGIVVISVFYSEHIVLLPALGAVALAVVASVCVGCGWLRLGPALLLAFPAWCLMWPANIEPAIVGALFGLLVPIARAPRDRPVHHEAERLLLRLAPVIGLLILPLFAAISAAVHVSGGDTAPRVAVGVAVALLIGKPAGVIGALLLAVRTGLGRRPEGTSLRELSGVAILAGVGFTVSMFIADVGFATRSLQESATLGVLLGSTLATACAALYFRLITAER